MGAWGLQGGREAPFRAITCFFFFVKRSHSGVGQPASTGDAQAVCKRKQLCTYARYMAFLSVFLFFSSGPRPPPPLYR